MHPDYFSSEKGKLLIASNKRPGSIENLKVLVSSLNKMFVSDSNPIILE